MAHSTFSSFVSNCLLDDVIVLKENHGQKVVAECWRLRCTVPADGSDHLFKNSTHCVLGYPNPVHKFHFLFFFRLYEETLVTVQKEEKLYRTAFARQMERLSECV